MLMGLGCTGRTGAVLSACRNSPHAKRAARAHWYGFYVEVDVFDTTVIAY